MKDFQYATPNTVDEAVALLDSSWGKTEVLCGGVDLVTGLKQGIASPDRIVNIKGIKELSGIAKEGDALKIGATTTLSTLVRNADVQSNFPALVTAARNIGAPQILNMATVSSDLLQRPRCWYYRQGFGLFGMKDGKSLVRDGDNRYHAIFGNDGDALFVHPSSLAPGLIALGATITVQGKGGSREIAAADFFQTPSSESDRETTMKPNEVLTSVSIPIKGLKNATYEVRQRKGLDWPMVSATVAFAGGGSISDARVVLGHVAPVPWRSGAAETALNGKSGDAAAAAAGAAAAQGATPLSMNGYKIHQVKVAVKRAVMAASA